MKKNKPFFSIVIPTLNRANDLSFTLYTILRQNFKNFEIIVSDNASTDNTREVVSSFKDKRIKYYRNKTNLGFARNVQSGVVKAKGEYVFLHSDDDFLLYNDSLKQIHRAIVKKRPGYVRVNYYARDPKGKKIFSYHGNKPFTKDYFILGGSKSKKVMDFILRTDPSFITGVIFKNKVPKGITTVDSVINTWVKIVFYAVSNWGGYFISDHHIIASWSEWSLNKNKFNPLFSLRNGKLTSEDYFNYVKEILSPKDYKQFLYSQLEEVYVRMFPAIKYYMGNKRMLQLAARIAILDPRFKKKIIFWIYLIPAIIIPRFLLGIVKKVFFLKFTELSKAKENNNLLIKIDEVKKEFINAREI